METTIIGKVKSEKGFYVGDICYALSEIIYHDVWGGANYADGIYEEPETGLSFAVARTAYGDGTYYDDGGHSYPVDAGCIGIVPLELCERGTGGGQVFDTPGEADFEACEGVFDITLPNRDTIHINTDDEEDEDEDWCDEEDEDEDW